MGTTVRQPFNPAQLELLSTMASLNTEADLIELKQALARFFADRADREMERLWNEGAINEETLESWKHEHMRTPYHQNAAKV
jgi:cell division protein ZapA (FtsZ GTPase activity inhibitor)